MMCQKIRKNKNVEKLRGVNINEIIYIIHNTYVCTTPCVGDVSIILYAIPIIIRHVCICHDEKDFSRVYNYTIIRLY